MWKSIGSAQSGDDKSIRSNRSRQQTRFEQFHKTGNRRSQLSPEANRSFCQEYFSKKRDDTRNMTYNQRAKSQQKSEKPSLIRQDDMFTSMRNVLSKEELPLSKIQSRNMDVNPNPNSKIPNEKRQRIFKQAQTRVKNLKRDQIKLKGTIQKEFTTLKNYLYQFQETIHEQVQKQQKAQTIYSQEQPQFVRQIMQQAVNIQKYFQDMDKKKALIMQKLSRQE